MNNNIVITWIALPLFIGFTIYLIPKLDKWLALLVAIASLAFSGQILLQQNVLDIQLLDNFGVSAYIDELSGFFILTNALVTLSVITYCWNNSQTAFFYLQLVILHGSVNATFITTDFISLYVALEVISIGAFMLITYARSDKSIWVGLRYLFISNTAMLFYLVGAILVYKANNSFNYQGLINAPPEAITLILLALLVKGGIFVSGLWLPLTHSESQSQVSAMLSGIVVKAGVFPLVRCALLMEEIDPIIRFFGVATALLGVIFAMLEKDTKRTLALSTISQLGFIMAAPVAGGFYALSHGLAKSSLFLTAGKLPSRNFEQLRSQSIDYLLWAILAIAALSISGFPLLAGYGAKTFTTKNLLSWQEILLTIATIGTVITYAKFILLPHNKISTGQKDNWLKTSFFIAIAIPILGLIIANIYYLEAYNFKNLLKPIITITLGWLSYLLIINKFSFKLPRGMEQLDRLIGGMSVMLIIIFWMVRV